jgi:hypothetical protein
LRRMLTRAQVGSSRHASFVFYRPPSYVEFFT